MGGIREKKRKGQKKFGGEHLRLDRKRGTKKTERKEKKVTARQWRNEEQDVEGGKRINRKFKCVKERKNMGQGEGTRLTLVPGREKEMKSGFIHYRKRGKWELKMKGAEGTLARKRSNICKKGT